MEKVTNCKYAYVLLFDGKPFHMCGYAEKPTGKDLQILLEEILTDKEFEKQAKYVKQLDRVTFITIKGRKLHNFLKLLDKHNNDFSVLMHEGDNNESQKDKDA